MVLSEEETLAVLMFAGLPLGNGVLEYVDASRRLTRSVQTNCRSICREPAGHRQCSSAGLGTRRRIERLDTGAGMCSARANYEPLIKRSKRYKSI